MQNPVLPPTHQQAQKRKTTRHSNDTNTGIDDSFGSNDDVTKTQVHKEYETDSSNRPKTINSAKSIIAEHSIVDEDGDLIMASIKALIEEQFTDSPNSNEKEKEPECFDPLGASETVNSEMDYIKNLSLNTTARTKIDKLSIRACRQLVKKLDTLSQTDTLAGKHLRAFKKQSHHSSRGRNTQPSSKGSEALASDAVTIGQSGSKPNINN
ncbi:hypothetical protein INT45_010958 [Circinella minor]|uniref:Uncharacterized protein n=1 Tax=Circinella minor TaxID=1195481 RepID=A0A8H7RM91_9FUNG|nr:hypothetical protein INT45_010958 [Circinella minor]